MWGRKDETPSPAANVSGGGQARISKSLMLKGEITGSDDLVVDGKVEGTIQLKENSLTIGPTGDVRAQVQARSVTVLGRLEGKVDAEERVEIRKTGLLEGDVVTATILIEDGAVFRGKINTLKTGENAAIVAKNPDEANAKDIVEEAGEESFPASDPPPWTPTHI